MSGVTLNLIEKAKVEELLAMDPYSVGEPVLVN
jgi:hypothetical protein